MEGGEEQKKTKGPWFWVIIIGGAGCLVLFCVISVLAALLLPALAEARKMSKVTDCKNNLKQLGIYLYTYSARYGGDTDYPPAAQTQFWETLWSVPNSGQGVASRPGENGIFVCRVYSPTTGRSNASLDYTSPDFSNTEAYPGGRLTDRVRADTMIGGDIVEGDTPNHGGKPGAPSFRYNGLSFDGAVQSIEPDSPTDGTYRKSTTGARVR